MNKKPAWAGILLTVMLLLSGCGGRTATGEHLDSIPQQLMALNNVYESQGVQPDSAYSEEGKVYLEVHKSRKPWEDLSEDDKQKLEKAIFDSLHRTFPLEIKSFVLPDKADITGKIKAVDANRVLIVNEQETGSAIWIKLPANVMGGLKIGYQVNAWSNGIIAESLPRQTTGIQVQVINYETGNADVEGQVTALHVDKADQSFIEVDGQKYVVQPYTLYWINNTQAQLQDIQLEDKVEVWLTGYGDGGEMVSQIKVKRIP